MDRAKQTFSSFFDTYEGIHNKYGELVHPKQDFFRRFDLFTQRTVSDFYEDGVYVCGGSLFAILDRSISDDELRRSDSDIDIFVVRNNGTGDSLRKLGKILRHFRAFADERDLNILFVLRGLLVEVLIQNMRRIQVLMTNFPSIESCLSYTSATHLHLYFDGKTLQVSDAAVDSLMRRETRMCRAPIKDTTLSRWISRGVTPMGEILTTKMDKDYLNMLSELKTIKQRIDGDEFDPVDFDDGMCSTDPDRVLQSAMDLAYAKWNERRLKWLANCGIECDIDIFDLSIRLPAPGILYRCAFFKIGGENTPHGEKSNRQRRMLKIVHKESPAIFVEKRVVLSHPLVKEASADAVVKLRNSDNLRFLERYCERQAVVRFLDGVSHATRRNGNLYGNGRGNGNVVVLDAGTVVNVTFFVTIYDTLESIMYLDTVELQVD
jgi:hypothetical protein